LEFFLNRGFNVTGIDNLSTGLKQNVSDVLDKISKKDINPEFNFIEGDIRKYRDCIKSTQNIDVVYHEAALGSVQRSIENPVESSEVNITGTLNLLKASAKNNVKRFIYASSSSVYGDSKILPKHEEMSPNPKSIYAVSKLASEYYVRLFFKIYGLKTISLRYFNVFGKRQNPDSIYSAVIPIFLKNIRYGEPLTIFGDGNQNRDFTFIDNVIYANFLAMVSNNLNIYGNFYNVGCGENISLNEIVKFLENKKGKKLDIIYKDKRKGDVFSSLASLKKIYKDLGYEPLIYFYEGLEKLIDSQDT
jgi:UDP-N-acetylglucosamine/UDP-N-acetylgalactosamine 4-epimerase